ncbi:Holliday junction resolvase, partial [Pseudomonas sp. AL03]|nr:Holliday junction resolvase [Pseudomonas sp. AL03]
MRFLSHLSITPVFVAAFWMGSVHAFDLSTQGIVATGYATSMVTSAPFDPECVKTPKQTLAMIPQD